MRTARWTFAIVVASALAGVSADGATETTTEASPELDAAVRALTGDRTFKDAAIGVAILDVDSGRYLAVHNEHQPLNPASNAKLYTAGAALAILHGNHRFETTLGGNVRGAAVAGPLVLRGHGDPSLTTADLWSMVQELVALGVRRVEGDILVDQLFFDDQTTPPAFEQQPNEWAAFRAPVSAVALNENTVTLEVRPTSVGSNAVAWFDPPGFVDVDGDVKTAESGADTVGLELHPSGSRLSAKLSGAVAVDSRLVRYTRRVEDPTLLAGFALKAVLDQAGVKVSGEVKAGGSRVTTVIARHQSEPLSTLVYELGKSSDNFYAEMIFKSLGAEAKARPGRSQDGAEVVTRWIDKIGANDAGVVIKNGSGLFDADRVTTASVVQLLRAVWRDASIQPEFLSQLSIGGVDGTLHRRFRAERTRRAVRAKTGTLDEAATLSGYVLGPPGKGPIAFSILFNNVEGKVGAARSAADTLVEILARREWAR